MGQDCLNEYAKMPRAESVYGETGLHSLNAYVYIRTRLSEFDKSSDCVYVCQVDDGGGASHSEQRDPDLNVLRILIEANREALTKTTNSNLLPLDCLAQNELATEDAIRMIFDMSR